MKLNFVEEPAAGSVETVRIDVIDSGPGVPKEVRNSLFEPFVTTKTQGTGLGLAISQQIIEDHNGTIRCETVSGGTQFSIRLPRGHTEAQDVDAAAVGKLHVQKDEVGRFVTEVLDPIGPRVRVDNFVTTLDEGLAERPADCFFVVNYENRLWHS